MKLSLKVVPGASRNGVAGWLEKSLKIRVTAPPENGKANAAILDILADALDIPKASIQIVSGSSSPRKIVEIRSLTKTQVYERLAYCEN